MKPCSVIRFLVVGLFAAALRAQTYDFSTTPYVHTQSLAPCWTYSGNSCIQPQQWGFIDIDPIAHAFQMKSGVGKNMAGYQSPKIAIIGDCWQSGTQTAASFGVRKWVLVIGTPPMCAASGVPSPGLAVQVWKYELGQWNWKGQVGSNVLYPPTPTGKIGIVGDYGYVREYHGGIPPPPFTWSKIELASITIVQTGIPEASLPPLEDQQGINGVTYTLSKIANPATYRLAASGGTTPTPTAIPATPTPVPTPGPNPYAAWIEQLYKDGITAGCGGGNFCPHSSISREQLAVWILKAKYGAAYLPPPCTGVFNDVPCSPTVMLKVAP